MKSKIITMLQMQDTMNCKVHPEWRTQGFNWTRAIMVEGVEALEHYGWKWWKKQEPDMVQFRMELVDIWHFIMSHEMVSNIDLEALLVDRIDLDFKVGASRSLVNQSVQENLQLLIGWAARGVVNSKAFLTLLEQAGMTFDDLYREYVAKNVLNMFRQAHGYKEGTYIKMWGDVEDNVVLARIMTTEPDASPEEITQALDLAYSAV